MRYFIFLLTLSFTLFVGTIDAQEQQLEEDIFAWTIEERGYDIQNIDLRLEWQAESNLLSGVAILNTLAIQDLDEFYLHFSGFDISEILLNGQTVTHHEADLYDETVLYISPTETISEGEIFSIEIHYLGVPTTIYDPSVIVATTGWIADEESVVSIGRTWYPHGASDSARFHLEMTVTQALTVVTSGVLVETINHAETSTYIWEFNTPGYITDLFIGRYDHRILEDTIIPIHVYTLDGTSTISTPTRTMNQMLELLEDVFGDYPFEQLTLVNMPQLSQSVNPIGRASWGIVSFTSYGLPERLIFHEFSHQWYGTSMCGDAWLIEGTATYAEMLWLLRAVYNDDITRFDDILGNIIAIEWDNVKDVVAPAIEYDDFNGAIYSRGSFTFLVLQYHVGSENFFEIMREALLRYQDQDGCITEGEFIALAEEISGQDLSELFDMLLYTDPLPALGELGVEVE